MAGAKKKKVKRLDPDDPLHLLDVAFAKVMRSTTAGRRRIARTEVRREVKKLLAHMDREYPLLTVGSNKKAPRRRRRGKEIADALITKGWGECPSGMVLKCAEAGVRLRTITIEATIEASPRGVRPERKVTLAPPWVLAVAAVHRPTEWLMHLKIGRKSRNARDAFVVEATLADMEDGIEKKGS